MDLLNEFIKENGYSATFVFATIFFGILLLGLLFREFLIWFLKIHQIKSQTQHLANEVADIKLLLKKNKFEISQIQNQLSQSDSAPGTQKPSPEAKPNPPDFTIYN